MAFLKRAKAAVVRPQIDFSGWSKIRVASTGVPFTKESAKVVLQQYDPANYLLTHCTIIASVDTEPVQAPLGNQNIDGFQIDRRYADFYVSDPTQKYINNNHDCWEKNLLLSCFKTFVGAENYVEHIQIPSMSKGKIIDAAARDIGESVYVDILVATERKNHQLINAITGGKLQTLSMGCQVQFTICTKCGNVAYDETQLCPHIRYQKGTDFFDELGRTRRIAELCGHVKAEPGSVKFIEASWVANPAFTGAVLRSILTPEEAAMMGPQIMLAHADADPSEAMMQRAASMYNGRVPSKEFGSLTADFDLGQGQGGGGDQGSAEKKEPEKKEPDAIDKLVSDLKNTIRDRVLEDLRKEMGGGESKKVQEIIDNGNENDSLIKSAMQHPAWREIARSVIGMTGNVKIAKKVLLGLIYHKKGGWLAIAKSQALTGREILAVARVLEHTVRRASLAGEARIYRTVLAVGGLGAYKNTEDYLMACRQTIGRNLTTTETTALLHKGQLFSLGS